MNTPSSVYILKPNLTDPRFDGFVLAPGSKSVLGNDRAYQDLLVDNAESLDWRPKSLKASWNPWPVKGAVGAFNDFPCLDLSESVFSHRAVNALGEMLTENGELLPLKTAVGDYSLYVVLTKLDALDLDNSRLHRTSKTKTALDIDYFAFKKQKLAGAAIFRVPEHPNIYLVTDQFKDRTEQAALNGFSFTKVWPLPKNREWRQDEIEERRAKSKTSIAGQGLTLCLKLAKQSPNGEEKLAALQLTNALRSILNPNSVQDKYWGAVETTVATDGEYRITCSCPDCDELGQFLVDWLDDVTWGNEIAIVKRYGNLYFGRAATRRIIVRKGTI